MHNNIREPAPSGWLSLILFIRQISGTARSILNEYYIQPSSCRPPTLRSL